MDKDMENLNTEGRVALPYWPSSRYSESLPLGEMCKVGKMADGLGS